MSAPVLAATPEPEAVKTEETEELSPENQAPPLTAEEFLQRIQKGERDFTGVNLSGVDLSGKGLNYS